MAKVVANAVEASGPEAVLGPDMGFGPASETSPLPRADRPYMFFYAYHPERWQVMAGRVVPMLAVVQVIYGLSGTTPGRGARRAKEAREERGWISLDPTVDGTSSYIYSTPGPRGPIYLAAWETANEGSDKVTCDVEQMASWLQGLVERDIIKPPKPYVLTSLRSELAAKVSQLIDACRLSPSMADLLEAAKKDLDVVDKTIKSVPAKPVTKRQAVSSVD